MQKPIVFISHITEEKEIAQALKTLVESTFLDMIEVFVSTDPASIKLGRKWLDIITGALKSCKVEIILASPESVTRPWINFEGGAGWVREIAVIPLCHSGMTPAKLPPPLNALQSATAADETSMRIVFGVLTEVVGSSFPQVDFTRFISVVKSFEETSRQIHAMQAITSVATTDGLSPHELATLVEVAEQTCAPGDKIEVQKVRDTLQRAGLRGVAVVLALKMLSRKDLVETFFDSDWNHNEFPVVRITDEGWAWLQANLDKLTLVTVSSPSVEEKISSSPEFKEDDVPF